MRLTKRKREILELASRGNTDKEIAAKLGLSSGTIQTHWKQIRSVLNVSTRSEAVAKVMKTDSDAELAELDHDRMLLAEKLDLSANRTLSLEQQVHELEAFVQRQAVTFSQSLAAADRRAAKLAGRLEQLEALNTLLADLGVIVHQGDYGASWRKRFISDHIRITGTTPEAWVKGDVNFFDLIEPRYLHRNLPLLQGLAQGPNRTCVTYFVNCEGVPRFFLDFLQSGPLDETGVGFYRGMSIDITDWLSEIRSLVERGWLEPLPAAE